MNDLSPVSEQIEKELLTREMEKILITAFLCPKVEVPTGAIYELLQLPLTARLRETLMVALNRRRVVGNVKSDET